MNLESGIYYNTNSGMSDMSGIGIISAASLACGWVCAVIAASGAGIVGLVYGILAVIPSAPFEEQDIGLGVSLIVLSVFGVLSIGGLFVGFVAGFAGMFILGLIFYVPVVICYWIYSMCGSSGAPRHLSGFPF